jgi:protein gp37
MYKRFKWNPEIRLDYFAFEGLNKIKIVDDGGYIHPKIFIGSTHDIFGEWIPSKWIESFILKAVQHPEYIFIFLTKNPKRYSDFDFPKNAWIGYSTTGSLYHEWDNRHKENIKFVSIEPMMGEIVNTAYLHDTQWVIIGAETGNRKDKVKLDNQWLYDALFILDDNKIPVFIKNNAGGIRQDYPENGGIL